MAGTMLGFCRGLGRLYTGLCVLGAKIGLVVLVLTGEMLALQAYLQPWIPVQLLRQTHALAGLILMLSMPGQLLRFASWIWFWPLKKPGPDPVGIATSHQRGFSLQGMLDAAFWSITLLMVLTGLERFARLEYDSAFLPLFPVVWWPLHSTLRLYWYALFLLFFVNYGKIWTKRALNYLRSP
ncbi:MAG: hypothetical protein V3S64_07535 [bacterium]